MANSDVLNEKVESYYENVGHMVETYFDDHGHENLHYGYADDENDTIDSTAEATNGLNELLAETAEIDSDDRVLFSGCGFGGPAVWVAQNYGAEAVGINIVESQLEQARKNAEEAGVADRTDFRYDDLTEMETVEDDSIDVVWAIEAVIYAEDKRDFFEQADRVLSEDGRLVVAEGFRAKREFSPDEEELLGNVQDGWAIPNLSHVEDFTAGLEETGFSNVETKDITQNVKPFSEWQFLGTHWTYLFKLLGVVGILGEDEIQYQLTRRYQYRTIEEGLLQYAVVSAQR